MTIALEIASSPQPIIDEIVEGKEAVAAIKIAPMIDHPPFRAMIDDLARMRRNGACDNPNIGINSDVFAPNLQRFRYGRHVIFLPTQVPEL